MQRLHGIAGQELPSSMLARSPTVQGLAETLAAIPPVDPQQQDAISHAPFTPAQRAAGVPCAAMQERAARSYLVRASPPFVASTIGSCHWQHHVNSRTPWPSPETIASSLYPLAFGIKQEFPVLRTFDSWPCRHAIHMARRSVCADGQGRRDHQQGEHPLSIPAAWPCQCHGAAGRHRLPHRAS